MDGSDYKVFDHTADVGIEAWGKDLAELFRNAARAMFDVAVDLKTIEPKEAQEIEVEAEDASILMHHWLSELLYWFTAKGWVFGKFEFEEISETKLKAKAWGERFEDSKHQLKTDIKAVTYHQLEVKPSWRAKIILDL
jgi:SHS2 domain-containing protein